MPVAFDAVGAGNNSTSSGTLSWTHTTSTNTNSVVLVGIAGGKSAAGYASYTTRTVTYGGVAMTRLAAVNANNSTGSWVELYYLLNPATGAQTVSVTYSGGTISLMKLTGNSVSYTGVASVDAAVTGFGSSTTPTVTVTSASNNRVVTAMVSAAVLSGYTQTQRYLDNFSTAGTAPCNGVIGDAAGAASVTAAATSASSPWASIGANLVTASNEWTGGAATAITATATAAGAATSTGSASTAVTTTSTANGVRGALSGAATTVAASTTGDGVRGAVGMATTTIVAAATANGAAGSAATTTITATATADGSVVKAGTANTVITATPTAAGGLQATGQANTTVVVTRTANGTRKTSSGAATVITATPVAGGVSGDVGGATLTITVAATANGTTDGPPGTVRLTFSWIDADGGTPPWVHITLIPDARGSTVSPGGSVSPTPVDIYSKTGAGSRNIEPGDYRCKVTFGDPAALRYDGAGWINYQPITVDSDIDLREALEGILT